LVWVTAVDLQILLSTSYNWNYWCIWQVYQPFFEQPHKETHCKYVWWPQRNTVAPLTPLPICG